MGHAVVMKVDAVVSAFRVACSILCVTFHFRICICISICIYIIIVTATIVSIIVSVGIPSTVAQTIAHAAVLVDVHLLAVLDDGQQPIDHRLVEPMQVLVVLHHQIRYHSVDPKWLLQLLLLLLLMLLFLLLNRYVRRFDDMICFIIIVIMIIGVVIIDVRWMCVLCLPVVACLHYNLMLVIVMAIVIAIATIAIVLVVFIFVGMYILFDTLLKWYRVVALIADVPAIAMVL